MLCAQSLRSGRGRGLWRANVVTVWVSSSVAPLSAGAFYTILPSPFPPSYPQPPTPEQCTEYPSPSSLSPKTPPLYPPHYPPVHHALCCLLPPVPNTESLQLREACARDADAGMQCHDDGLPRSFHIYGDEAAVLAPLPLRTHMRVCVVMTAVRECCMRLTLHCSCGHLGRGFRGCHSVLT